MADEFDTAAVSETVLSDPKTPNDKPPSKRRGRPRLTEEEKAQRKAEREAAKARGETPKPTTRRKGPADLPIIEESLTAYMTAIGLTLSYLPKTAADGPVIVANAEPYAHAWCELARTDKRVYKALKALCTGGAWTGVVIGTVQIALPIAANHNLIPDSVASVAGVFVAANEDTDDDNE